MNYENSSRHVYQLTVKENYSLGDIQEDSDRFCAYTSSAAPAINQKPAVAKVDFDRNEITKVFEKIFEEPFQVKSFVQKSLL